MAENRSFTVDILLFILLRYVTIHDCVIKLTAIKPRYNILYSQLIRKQRFLTSYNICSGIVTTPTLTNCLNFTKSSETVGVL